MDAAPWYLAVLRAEGQLQPPLPLQPGCRAGSEQPPSASQVVQLHAKSTTAMIVCNRLGKEHFKGKERDLRKGRKNEQR